MSENKSIRDHILNLLDGGHAYATFDTIVRNFPFEMTGKKPDRFDHSAWQILEHIRIAQWDIVEFSVSADHISPKWPEEYWPKNDTLTNEKQWQDCINGIKKDLQKMKDIVSNPSTDLFAKIPHGTGQTILREVLLIADHNAYHLGQIVVLRKILGIWPPKE